MNHKLLAALFKHSRAHNSHIYSSLLDAVVEGVAPKLCILWKVNNVAQTLSVRAERGYCQGEPTPALCVHPIEGSLIGYLLARARREHKPYLDIPSVKEKPFYERHLARHLVDQLDLERLVFIPILNLDAKDERRENERYEIDCVLTIYPAANSEINTSDIELLQDFVALALSRARLQSKERLAADIRLEYETKGTREIGRLLHVIISDVLRKYVAYEGCSIFIWDPIANRLSLSRTTGIEGKPKNSDVYYYLGEGVTGAVARAKKPVLIPDLNQIEDPRLKSAQMHKWKEATPHSGVSFMIVPISSPSNPSDLLGVIRFTNRLNPNSRSLDYFSNEDLELVQEAANLVTLYMERDYAERIRGAYAMQMAHEVKTPAMAIRGTADRLSRKMFDGSLRAGRIRDYIASIYDHAELQIALTQTIEYTFDSATAKPRSERYQVQEWHLQSDVIERARKVVIPIARAEELTFDRIEVTGDFPRLCVDRYAFQQVFFNMLTNTIKYRRYADANSFHVQVIGARRALVAVPLGDKVYRPDASLQKDSERRTGYVIAIRDYGMGITEAESDRIFGFGYRKPGIERLNVRGLGIGLTLVARITEDFNCKVWLASLQDPTEFRLFLPSSLESADYTYETRWQQSS